MVRLSDSVRDLATRPLRQTSVECACWTTVSQAVARMRRGSPASSSSPLTGPRLATPPTLPSVSEAGCTEGVTLDMSCGPDDGSSSRDQE